MQNSGFFQHHFEAEIEVAAVVVPRAVQRDDRAVVVMPGRVNLVGRADETNAVGFDFVRFAEPPQRGIGIVNVQPRQPIFMGLRRQSAIAFWDLQLER